MTKTIKKVLAGISAIVVLASAAIGGWAIGRAMNTNDNQLSIEQDNTAGANGAVIDEADSNGVELMSDKIDPADYAAYGVSAQADTAYTLTATVTPSDATDKSVTYSVAWKNANSTWAKGKTVTDYVTVKQPTTGALTATVTCLKAFGEQIIITCCVTSNVDLKATCTVGYLRKPLGADLSIKFNGFGSDKAVTWTFNHSSVNATVDFPLLANSGSFDQKWIFAWCNIPQSGGGSSTYGSSAWTEVYSDTYTIDNSATELYSIEVAITQEYYDVLDSLGYNLTFEPEDYHSPFAKGGLSIGNMILQNWTYSSSSSYGDTFDSYQDYVNLRSALKSLASTPMFRIKYYWVSTGDESADMESGTTQIYNVSFSSSSFNSILADGVSLGDTSLIF